MKKRIISMVLCIVMIFGTLTAFAAENESKAQTSDKTLILTIGSPVMTVNGAEKEIDPGRGTTPVIVNSRTLLPVRAIVEEIGGTVDWESETQRVSLSYNDMPVALEIGSQKAFVGGEEQTLDTAPAIINERTMLPIRFIMEAFGYKVDWDSAGQTITVYRDESAAENAANGGKTLIIYFSESGNTEKMAGYIHDEIGGDMVRIVPAVKYPEVYEELADYAKAEQDNNERPKFNDLGLDPSQYETVFIGYPIWWYTLPMIMRTFFDTYDFDGVTIIPFNTHHGSGDGGTYDLIKELEPNAKVLKGLPIRGVDIENDASRQSVKNWLDSLNLNEENRETVSKSLVVYFSQPETDKADDMTEEEDNSTVVIDGKVLGNTQYFAQVIADATGSDIFRIEPKTPYTTNHSELIAYAKEEQNNDARPEMLKGIDNLSDYDTIYLGYPIWWGDLPMIMYTFLENNDLSGKNVILFSTHGGSGWAGTPNTVKRLQPNANIADDGLSISRDDIQNAEGEILSWVKGLK
ncbi:MAG: flavodoxin [Firmicutes bacterium]|nr:flavodoxin [Bacillota bacterium]